MGHKIASPILACVLGTTALGFGTPAQASDAGAFTGGVLATKVLGNIR